MKAAVFPVRRLLVRWSAPAAYAVLGGSPQSKIDEARWNHLREGYELHAGYARNPRKRRD